MNRRFIIRIVRPKQAEQIKDSGDFTMTNKKTAYLYLFITFFIWGSLYVVSKFVLGKIPVLTVAFLRYVIAGIVLLLILKKKKLPNIERQDYKYIFFIGFIGYFVSMGAQLLGTKLSNASMASLINSINPIAIMLFAVMILKEKLTIKKMFCIILSIVGVYIIVGDNSGIGQVWGILISIFSVISWSLVSVIVRKVTQKYDAFQITTYGIIIGAICNLPCSIYELVMTPNVQFDWTAILSLLYMGLVCTAFAHVYWNKSLAMLEAGTCSLFYPLQPMSAVLLGWLFLGESININFIFGAILIISGVIFSIMGDVLPRKCYTNRY
ncbi:drug/metabolite transporter (DMT)-like permease [Sporomusaceae bacterium BoRhaA]|nr:drug/metabolite transporter (DMT)-like permease [Pelorhabdus rhamnosifermentans]